MSYTLESESTSWIVRGFHWSPILISQLRTMLNDRHLARSSPSNFRLTHYGGVGQPPLSVLGQRKLCEPFDRVSLQ
jgi:hypothetical protein